MTRRVIKDDFDFSKAAEYRKIMPLAKTSVRVAVQEEKIVSHHSGGVETENMAKPGDYIIKTKPEGDGYVVAADRFGEMYENDRERDGFYRHRETRLAMLTLEEVMFAAPWGEQQNVSAGGMIVEAGSHIYGIDKFSFIKNYGRVDGSADKKVFAFVSHPLEEQLAHAKALDLQSHVTDIELRIKHANLFI